jgi:hypothetical protein
LGGELWSDGGYIGTKEMEQLQMLSKTMLKIRETRKKKKHIRK